MLYCVVLMVLVSVMCVVSSSVMFVMCFMCCLLVVVEFLCLWVVWIGGF